MTRLFIKLFVDFDDDDKVARLARYGRDARGCRDLLVGMWRYCKREKSNGHVPAEVVGKLVYPDAPKVGIRDADRLVEVGLAEHTPTGYLVGGFLKHNKSREQIAKEAETKAEAGRKGGLASGQVRSGEASTKQGASPRGSQSSEFIDQSSDNEKKLGEQRYEPLRAVPEAQPTEARCTAHVGVAEPGPCRGCQAARERAERKADRTAEAASRQQREAIADCPDCHGTNWVEDDAGNPTRKCEHRRAS